VHLATAAQGGKKRPRVSPHVVFVGQLAYSTTAQAVEEHFREHGVIGDIRVRLLTDKKTGKSR
jgi:RNA recognition motif-containing protein